MTLATLSEAGSLPSKIMPPSVITHEPQQHPEAQPLLSTTARATPPHANHMHIHHPHWPPTAGPNHALPNHPKQQEMRV
ncbi:hypothetical protein CEXT_225311 [Caerostris extrusa]|nr:hypothetical protein CEXT_225311 [Caerostris extrusa]